MRTLTLAAVVSAGIHAAVVGWLVLRAPERRPADDAPAVTEIEIVTVESARPEAPEAAEAIDLQLPSSAPPPEAPPQQQPEPPQPRRSQPQPRQVPDAPNAPPAAQSAAITAVAPSPTAAPGATDTAATSIPPADRDHKHSVYMAMRTSDPSSAARPYGRWDVDHPPPGTNAQAPVPSSGLLFHAGGGTYEHQESVFDATVHPDGSVAITDRRNLNVHIALPTPMSLGRAVASWYTSDKGESAFGTDGDTSAAQQIQLSSGATATVKDPATQANPDHTPTVIVPVFAGGFDVTDWLMRNHKQDPYARRKLKFLDATRDERVEMGARDRSEQLAHTAQIVLRSLEQMWAATGDPATRKQALFELWDDCVETGDAAAVEAGAAARRMIIGFIRGRLPAGSAGAYTADELAALARKQHSSAAFQPYE